MNESLAEYYDLRLGLYDTCIAIIYFAFIYIIAFHVKKSKIAKNPEYKYFILGLTMKVIGGFTFALLTVYYWKGGDTLSYYKAATDFSNVLLSNPIRGIELLFTSIKDFDVTADHFHPYAVDFINDKDVLLLVKITSLINIIGLYSYGTTTVLFASISFIGLWYAYSNLCKIYPNYSKHLLIGFFMTPSIIFWSSGVLKDTITMSCIGWIMYSFSNVLFFKRKHLISIFLVIISSIIIFILKPYILYILIPCMLIWTQSHLKNLIKGSFIRIVLIPLIMILFVFGSTFIIRDISASAGKYDLNKVETTLEGFRSWHGHLAQTQNQSGYTLSSSDFSTFGMIKMLPEVLNVTFFRPYLWEIRNMPTLIGAFESIILLFFTLYLIITRRGSFFKLIYYNKDIRFMMIFALSFGFIVGISSYNFGALSRYKMPAQMFFILALTLIYKLTPNKRFINN